MLDTSGSMTFTDFQRRMEWCQSYFTKISMKAHDTMYGYYTTEGYLICRQFWTLY